MNKVITINLNGNAFSLEENGYEALRAYLETAARRLEGNPDKEEIIADIEQAIADKFRAVLGAYKTVVITKQVETVIAEMGPVQDPSGSAAEPAASATGPEPDFRSGAAPPPFEAARPSPLPKRLHKIRDGAMIGGVCNGLAAYFGVDVTLVRIGFVVLFLAFGTGALLYLLMMLIFPEATTPEERAAASGVPLTAQEFIRRAKEGYYEGMKTFTDKTAHHRWRKRFRREMRGWRREMREGARTWSQSWQRTWWQPPHPGPVAFIVFPLLAVAHALLAIVGVAAVVSLISTGAVFGVTLPFSAPLWVGILFLLVVYKIVVSPLKAVRHSVFYHAGYGSPFLGLGEAVVWLAFLVLLVWFAQHHRSQIHEALHHLPRVVQHAADSIQQWWNAP